MVQDAVLSGSSLGMSLYSLMGQSARRRSVLLVFFGGGFPSVCTIFWYPEQTPLIMLIVTAPHEHFFFPSDAFVASARSFNMFKSMLQLELID